MCEMYSPRTRSHVIRTQVRHSICAEAEQKSGGMKTEEEDKKREHNMRDKK